VIVDGNGPLYTSGDISLETRHFHLE